MKITIARDPVVLPSVLYAKARGNDGLIQLVCFNRSADAKEMLSQAQIGNVFDVLGHYEDGKDGARQYVVDVADKSREDEVETTRNIETEIRRILPIR